MGWVVSVRDPSPENISGEIVERHVFEHTVNWGYVAIAFVVLLLLWQFRTVLGSDEDSQL